mgnify:CR=1 FL=1
MRINKNTQICISIAKQAGNFGTTLHNRAFQTTGVNFVYKACSVDDLENAILGIRALGIRGAGITMPYKTAALNHVDIVDETAKAVGATNTITNTNGVLCAYNTDVYSTGIVLSEHNSDRVLYVLGNGGFASAVKFSATKLGFKSVHTITRREWHELSNIRDSIVFNCTPVHDIQHVIDQSNIFLDCLTNTTNGARMAILQATLQFELYTGVKFPFEIIDSDSWSLK